MSKIIRQTTVISLDRLREIINYDKETGQLKAKVRRGAHCSIGDLLGSIGSHGYLELRIDSILYLAHRLAWFYMTGMWPTHQIDHINGNRTDNRWVNLREVTHSENSQNRREKFRGVYKVQNTWFSQIGVNGRTIYLGSFTTPEQARLAYMEAKGKYHPFYSG